MRLSIIVYLSNTTKDRLSSCLESIYTSTLLASEEGEVIVIDDGSSINYSSVLENYGVRYVKTQKRGALASYLYGIVLASGEYVAFVKADGEVSLNMYLPMLRTGADIAINDIGYLAGTTRLAYSERANYEGSPLDFYANGLSGSLYALALENKIYKKSVLLLAKKEIENTDAIMKKHDFSYNMLINCFAFKNASKIETIHTGCAFLRIKEKDSISSLSKERAFLVANSFKELSEIVTNALSKSKGNEIINSNLTKLKNSVASALLGLLDSKENKEAKGELLGLLSIDGTPRADKTSVCVYKGAKPLYQNIREIEKTLLEIYKTTTPLDVFYDIKDAQVAGVIKYFNDEEKRIIAFSKDAKCRIPKAIKAKKASLNRSYKNDVIIEQLS